jgi:hypothetical protein
LLQNAIDHLRFEIFLLHCFRKYLRDLNLAAMMAAVPLLFLGGRRPGRVNLLKETLNLRPEVLKAEDVGFGDGGTD